MSNLQQTSRDIVARLSKLARKGAHAEPIDPSSTAYVILSPRNNFARPIAAMPAVTVSWGVQRGWLEAAPGVRCYRLSPAGAKALRRARQGQSMQAAMEARREGLSPIRAPHEGPIVWLSRHKDSNGRPMVTGPQRAAGERLCADYWHAQLTPRVTANWSGLAPGRRERRAAPDARGELSDHVAGARARVNRALAVVGPELSGILVDVCCHEIGLEAAGQTHGWPARAARVVLQLALTRLARHYGLIAPEPPARLRHWGGEDYKPTLDIWRKEDAPMRPPPTA